MMHYSQVINQLSDLNPDAIFFDGLDDAIIGVGYIGCQADPVPVYSRAKIYDKLLDTNLSRAEADEYYADKLLALDASKHMPVILDDMPQE